MEPKFKIDDEVEKLTGYKWPGIVVAVFTPRKGKSKGKWRYVVECTVPEVEGALHIYSETQIERKKE